jgi:hypothetical protein
MDAVEFNIVDVLNSKARRPFETTVHHHAAPSPQKETKELASCDPMIGQVHAPTSRRI